MLSLSDIPMSDAASLRLSVRGMPVPPLPVAAKTQKNPGKMQHQLTQAKKK